MIELRTLGRVRFVDDDGLDFTSSGAQPKRIALLSYLALETAGGPVRRDTLFALFWPEARDEDARRSLRQALHHLRRVVGDDGIVGVGDELSLDAKSFSCDAVTFSQLIAQSRFEEALALYQGDFMDGLHVDDVAPEYDEWVSRTRARLKRRAAVAAWAVADADVAVGRNEKAIAIARRACELDPDQEDSWRRLIALQHQLGDGAGAMNTYTELRDRLAREFDVKPSAETVALAEQLHAPRLTIDTAPPLPRRSRGALIGGVAAILAIATGVGAYALFSESRDGPSLVDAGSLVARDRVVVADFANLAGDSLLAAGITEIFRVDLSQSPLLRVLTPQQVAAALVRMKRPRDTTVTTPLAREVAEREGAKAIVSGSVSADGSAFTVSVQLVSAEQGTVLASLTETAVDSSGLIAAVDRASKELRHRIGESLRSLEALPPLDRETTASLAALRKFTEAKRLDIIGKRWESAAVYQQAIALDTGFAAAYSGLAKVYEALSEPGRSLDARLRAIAHRDRLPLYERTFLVGSFAYGARDYETAIDAYRRLLDKYPLDIRALNNLALIYQDRRQFVAAESLFRRASMIDSTVPNLYFGIHGTLLLQGKFSESRQTIDLIARRFPGNPVLPIVELQDASAQQHWDDAERVANATIAAAGNDSTSLIDPYELLGGMTMAQGRLAESERYWKSQLAITAATESWNRHLFGVLQLAALHQRYRNEQAKALRLVDSVLAARPLDSLLRGDRPYDALARFYASAGRLTYARELLAASIINDSLLARTQDADHAWTRGVIALADGRVGDAESALRQAADGLACTICALPDLARAYEAAHKPGAAATIYERYLTTPWFWRHETDGAELGWAMKQLAELYSARGDAEKAGVLRGRLLQLWRRADPELQAPIVDAEARAGARD